MCSTARPFALWNLILAHLQHPKINIVYIYIAKLRPWGQLLHLTPSHFSFNKSSQRMNFSGLFVAFVSWRMQQSFCKFSLLQLLYNGGYTNLRENRNNSTRSPLLANDDDESDLVWWYALLLVSTVLNLSALATRLSDRNSSFHWNRIGLRKRQMNVIR